MGLLLCPDQDQGLSVDAAADHHRRILQGGLAIRAGRSIRSSDVFETLAGLMTARGVAEHIRSDSGSEFTVNAVREWLGQVGAMTLYIEPGSPWENGVR